MTNYIWMAIGAHFTVGLLLWMKVVIKMAMLLMNSVAPNDAHIQKMAELGTEMVNESIEECGSKMRCVSLGVLGNLMVIVAWPEYMLAFEESALSTAREIVEEVNRT